MSFGQAVKTCMRKYADFSGRGRRSEFWWFYLFTQVLQLPLVIVATVLYVAAFVGNTDAYGNLDIEFADMVPTLIAYGLVFVVGLVFFIPFLAASARRLHDMGQSGHWLWLNLVSLGMVPLIMCVMDTQPYDNRWGMDPKAAERSHMGDYYSNTAPPPLA
jgi:uncharacterized membrane protein YhaH (DUF805 family)